MSQPTAFSQHRRLLLSIAHRLLGNNAAEDVVQEAYVRWSRASPDELASPKTYLAGVVTRLCLARLEAAAPPHAAPVTAAAPSAAVIVLQSLAPVERAIFLLRDVFAFDDAEIAATVQQSEEHCRVVVRRARERSAARRPHFATNAAEVEHITQQFFVARRDGDLGGLLALLAPDVRLVADAGDAATSPVTIRTLGRPLEGDLAVARFLLGAQRLATSVRHRFGEIEGAPSLLGYRDGVLISALRLDVVDGRVRGIHIVADAHRLQELAGDGFEH